MTQLARYPTVLTYYEERIDAMATILHERNLTMSFFKDWRDAKVETLPLGCFTKQEEQAASIIFPTSDNAKINFGQRLCLNLGGVML